MINLELFRSETTWDAVPEAVLTHYDSQLTNSGSYDDLGVSAAFVDWAVVLNFCL